MLAKYRDDLHMGSKHATDPDTGSSDVNSAFFGFGGARLALLGLIGRALQDTHTHNTYNVR